MSGGAEGASERSYAPEAEAAADWPAYQDELVRRAVRLAAPHGELRGRLERAETRADEIRAVADLARLPPLPKSRLPALQAEAPPFGDMLAVPLTELKGIYLSPGPILDPEGARADFWRLAPALWAAGFRSGDLVHNTFSYHLTPAGAMFEGGLRALGCVVVPAGVGNTETQVELLARTGAVGYVGTPGFLLTLLRQARAQGVALGLTRAQVSGGPCPESLRRELQDELGVSVYQAYGTADAGALAYECEVRQGWHVAPGVVIELLDPASGLSIAGAGTGEVVVTSPNEVYPLVRFGTGDLSAFADGPCPCGRTSPRLVGFLGRVGDGIKVRGMFVHPADLGRVMRAHGEVARYQGVVGEQDHQDTFTVRVEAAPGASVDTAELEAALKAAVKLRVSVEVVAPGELAGDAPPLVDVRSLD